MNPSQVGSVGRTPPKGIRPAADPAVGRRGHGVPAHVPAGKPADVPANDAAAAGYHDADADAAIRRSRRDADANAAAGHGNACLLRLRCEPPLHEPGTLHVTGRGK